MYEFYLGDLLLPVAPESLQIKIKNQNSTVTLINESEFNFIKAPGLSELSFDMRIPAVKYPFANYNGDLKNQKYYLDKLKKLKNDKKPFRFIVNREMPDGTGLYDTNIRVSLEDYTIKEQAGDGFDITVSITLKEYNDIKTSVVNIADDGTATIEKQRETDNSPEPQEDKSYTVKSGDTLWVLAKKFYDDGSKYADIAKANSIANPNRISVGQKIIIPAL
ncbi:MAG: LysM peptidoglycan-binding domain-containing protein [Clostridia bacterium]|jgi:hypothetical protein|nr:LysM peptidoglycan-binding domain-containing protein [Clostridia bacterium]MCI2014070.1 LysM peptidoglycan-binding domain-containing protein [Clostridia bacterium]